MSTEAKTTSAKIAAAEVLIIGLYGLIKRALGEATGQPEGVRGEIYARVILSVRKMIKTAAYLDPASGLPRVLFPARHPLAKLMSEHRMSVNRVSDEKGVCIICSSKSNLVRQIWSINVDNDGHYAEIHKDDEIVLSIYGKTSMNVLERSAIGSLLTILLEARVESKSWRKSLTVLG